MKLTPELLTRSNSSLNHLGDRTLDLRGLKIPAIENLGVTRDQNDAIDLTDNDIRHLGNFPLLTQLKHLLLSNNLITRIDPRLAFSLPALHTLTLTNNSISDLAELSHLSKCSRLEYLCLMGNPVAREKHYRGFVIWKLPQVRVLDYQRIRDKERELAKELMETEDGRPSALAASILRKSGGESAMDVDGDVVVGKKKTFEPGRLNGSSRRLLTPEERKAIEDAIEKSESLDEIRRLEEQLKMGHTFVDSS
ncbi:related to U2 snRNP protein A` [Ustilago trichophora]|uniref:U2 small nuclear ribonucleoprotein A' n=1 Tax=Ustilago trichophora TaxID=86804 RepID=A0A5C3EKJ3_9BASI|nr:related to U2 snRNP protein A` [Ustilago trichophora]